LLPIMIWLNIPFSPTQSPYRVRDGAVCLGSVHNEKKLSVFTAVNWHCPRPAGAYSGARNHPDIRGPSLATAIGASRPSPREGPLTEPTAGAQSWPRESVLMPLSRHLTGSLQA
jgi:hypothetical protein